jgi:peptidoglycan hydrolase CwlO-like protein
LGFDFGANLLELMGKKNHQKAINSLNQRIFEHQAKIQSEQARDYPDEGLIHHWEKEIRAFEKGIQQALKRLGR